MAKTGDVFYTDMRDIHAEGVVTDKGFTVRATSTVRDYQASYLVPAIAQYRQQCLSDGTIVGWQLTRDLDFDSPSTAAAFRLGSNASVPASWKGADGVTMLKLGKAESGAMPSIKSEYAGLYKTVEGNER